MRGPLAHPVLLTSSSRTQADCFGVAKATDGSHCTLVVDELCSTGLLLEHCSVCGRRPGSLHEPTPLRQGCLIRVMLGQCPDMLLEKATGSSFRTIRSMLESVLNGCVEGDVLTLELTVCEQPLASEDSSPLEAPEKFTLVLRVLSVQNPPVCTHNPSTPRGEETDDPLSNPTSDWNPELARFWYHRACLLKERGNWLIQKHSERQGTEPPTGAPLNSTSSLDVWAAAFKCYSRGLQLATLARSAYETCSMENHTEGDSSSLTTFCSQPILKGNGDEEMVISLDHPKDFSFHTTEPCGRTVERLEFSLLLNLALCQLKAGSAYSAARNCTQALRMDPGWIKMVQSEIYPECPVGSEPDAAAVLSSHDVAKALYRRAQSQVAVSKWEEAVADLQSATRLQKRDPAKAGLALSESLLSYARQKMSQDDSKLAERLRNRRGLF